MHGIKAVNDSDIGHPDIRLATVYVLRGSSQVLRLLKPVSASMESLSLDAIATMIDVEG